MTSDIERAVAAGCPVVHTDFRIDRPAFWHFDELPALAAQADIAWNTTCDGFWMLHRYDHVREVLQHPEIFTNDTISPFHRTQELRLVPQILNPPEHVRYRHLLNPWFSAASIARREPAIRAHCATLVEQLVERDGCDFVAEFAIRFPTEIFMQVLGLPLEDGETFLPWIETIFAGFFGGDPNAAGRAIGSIYRHFDHAAAEREANPRDPATDFISYLLAGKVGDEPLPRAEVLTICMTLTLAGLDTTRAQLGYMFWHLANHADDRHPLIADPSRVPGAVEEFLRLYGIILTAGRQVAQDIDFHGVPMRAGDVVWLGVLTANRDPDHFPNADRYVPDRSANPHLAFAAGAHRCLGAHLARLELAIALEEWHRRIPNYAIAPDTALEERGGQLTLRHLPLVWPAS